MEKFVLSWAFPVSILLVISFISFLIARRYICKKKAIIGLIIYLFLSFIIGLYIQTNRYTIIERKNWTIYIFDQLTGKEI